MHIWNTKDLIAELASGKLSEWEMTQYVIATGVFWSILGGNISSSHFETMDWLLNAAYAIITGVGIYYCFTINRKTDNKNFIIRLTVLSWPVALRWLLLTVTSLIVLAFIFRLITGSNKSLTEHWVMDIYMLFLEGLYFIMLAMYIKRVGNYAKRI